MDISSLATTFAVTQQARTDLALQSEMMKMAAESQTMVVDLLQQGAQSLEAVAPRADGLGQQLNITA
ncbi:hypothetical protein [Roseibium suaedae]|uniref:Motility protein n=1 Tax=Roseibium suaedae TaxID=735517 RepID=A0A1M7MRQ3_9HYPH|nr:hypothetical protein [Roseibium suaedae]SHM93770.1 hypothetical protein SAMN05444272_3523 [Roseibium suaedae]